MRVIPIPISSGVLCTDGLGGRWVTVTSEELRFPDRRIALSDDARGQAASAFECRLLSDGRIVLNTSGGGRNTFALISASGDLERVLEAGHIEDWTAVSGFVVTGFKDQTIFSDDGPEENGLVAYDFGGRLALEYQKDIAHPVMIDDLYALSAHSPTEVAFCPFAGFEVVLLDVDTRTQRTWPTPNHLHGCDALSVDNEQAWLVSPYDDRDGVHVLDLKTGASTRVTHYKWPLRGVGKGWFIEETTEPRLVHFGLD